MNRLIAFCLLLLTLPAAYAQTGEDVLLYSQRYPAVGARMTGMAGAGVGGVNSWGATFANPAGLGLIPRSHVSGSLSAGTLESEAAYFGDRESAAVNQTALGSAAYVAALPTLRGAFVLGIGYNETAGFDRELSFSGVNPDVSLGRPRQSGGVFEDGQAGELSLAGAVEVAPRVLAGLSLNLVAGNYVIDKALSDGVDPNVPVYLQADLSGVNVRAGVTAEVAPGVRLGLSTETPTYYRVEEEYDFIDEFDDFLTSFTDYSVTTPWRVSGGIAYEMAGFLLAADLEFLDWSQARLRPVDDFLDTNIDVRRDYREVVNTRFGAEYAIGPWAVRAGAAYQPDPLRDVVSIDRLRSTYTVGFSFQLPGRATLDVAYALTEFEDEFVPGQVYGAISEEVLRNRFLVGLQVDL